MGALAAGLGFAAQAQAQTVPAAPSAETRPSTELPAVTVTGARRSTDSTSLNATQTTLGKGRQALKDIPQSVTVMTEKLISDRNLDDFRDVLRTTAGVTFLAGETGEEDVRIRGFSLGQAGDIYVDGIRDGALYDRDTFNQSRVEVLKGSASMLFGKGSTGGVVNQVSKQPGLVNRSELKYTLGTGNQHRVTGDWNARTGSDSALRVNALIDNADNDGAEVSKLGFAPTFRWGIGARDEFSVGATLLQTHSRPQYNLPWFIVDNVIQTAFSGNRYYGLAGDHNDSSAYTLNLGHIHRFDAGGELNTRLRYGHYRRDLLASVIRFGPAASQPGGVAASPDTLGPDTVLTRSPKGRVSASKTLQLQSDFSQTFQLLGREHSLLAGLDYYREDARRNNNYTRGATASPATTVGTPNDGAVVPDTRVPLVYNTFGASNLGLYVQDLLTVAPQFKLLAGARVDHFKANYVNVLGDGASGERSDTLFSPRLGAIYQPTESSSYYLSYGTSYNTSGDAYQWSPSFSATSAAQAAVGPEKSRNIELGAKWELWNQQALLGLALFRSEKYNERNQDPDSATTQFLLSGKRHAKGLELNFAGRITPKWEAFFNHTWIPQAKIDASSQALAASGGGAQVQGDRPGLTPKHSGSVWSTYQITPALRLGGGINYRSSQNPEGQRLIRSKAYATVDAMAEYTLAKDTTVRLNASNLFNKVYAESLYRGFYTQGPARSVQLSLSTAF
ncbi:TonB-dependent receptor [Amphibiibacter pelophylacis]|uniref:TonB-dependent siderophore receptor n=1 Tax=Amphibiibacter pelophylacis TaxID=1799477 RepID=A0ACC6P103_9BURK